jgi:hypothetical protein
MKEIKTDILIVGGGTGGVAAAMAATSLGHRVIMTEEYAWLGGQLTSQAVPPDENFMVETVGATARYAKFRRDVRKYYAENYPFKSEVRNNARMNPGGGGVSRLCHNPAVGVAVINAMLAPIIAGGLLKVMQPYKPVAASMAGDTVRSVTVAHVGSGEKIEISAAYVLDATELGDLLPLTGTEYVSGAESQAQTGELHALAGEAEPENVQSLTWVFMMGYDATPGADHRIERPANYTFWKNYVPSLRPAPWSGPLLDWKDVHPVDLNIHRNNRLFPGEEGSNMPNTFFNYRKVQIPDYFDAEHKPDAVTCVNWPMNDYMEGNIIDKSPEEVARHLAAAKELSRCLLYWLQTDAPNKTTGGTGYPGLYLRPDFTGTEDGFAQAPYIRESRRIKAQFTVTEAHIGAEMRWTRKVPYHPFTGRGFDVVQGPYAADFFDSVGIGHYAIDLHPSTNGTNYVDVGSTPFEIPLGALLPVKTKNLFAAGKNLGVTHITNGCYRLHPVEWNIGEAAGLLAAYCLKGGHEASQVRNDRVLLYEFQGLLEQQGVTLNWPWMVSPRATKPESDGIKAGKA